MATRDFSVVTHGGCAATYGKHSISAGKRISDIIHRLKWKMKFPCGDAIPRDLASPYVDLIGDASSLGDVVNNAVSRWPVVDKDSHVYVIIQGFGTISLMYK